MPTFHQDTFPTSTLIVDGPFSAINLRGTWSLAFHLSLSIARAHALELRNLWPAAPIRLGWTNTAYFTCVAIPPTALCGQSENTPCPSVEPPSSDPPPSYVPPAAAP